jgi:hypothetical protein
MRPETFKNEAEHCRRQAETAFSGRPESALLLRLAGAFDELALERPTPDLIRGQQP